MHLRPPSIAGATHDARIKQIVAVGTLSLFRSHRKSLALFSIFHITSIWFFHLDGLEPQPALIAFTITEHLVNSFDATNDMSVSATIGTIHRSFLLKGKILRHRADKTRIGNLAGVQSDQRTK